MPFECIAQLSAHFEGQGLMIQRGCRGHQESRAVDGARSARLPASCGSRRTCSGGDRAGRSPWPAPDGDPSRLVLCKCRATVMPASAPFALTLTARCRESDACIKRRAVEGTPCETSCGSKATRSRSPTTAGRGWRRPWRASRRWSSATWAPGPGRVRGGARRRLLALRRSLRAGASGHRTLLPRAIYSTFTRATSFPSASTVWMAQARQGSKEWMVRNASSGSFADRRRGCRPGDAS